MSEHKHKYKRVVRLPFKIKGKRALIAGKDIRPTYEIRGVILGDRICNCGIGKRVVPTPHSEVLASIWDYPPLGRR